MAPDREVPPQRCCAGLHSEQRALVDLLVLTKGRRFVGHPFSTLSVLVEQMRLAREERPEQPTHYLNLTSEPNVLFDQFVRYAKDGTHNSV